MLKLFLRSAFIPVVLAVGLSCSTSIQAADASVDSVSGTWMNVSPAATATGEGTNEIRWGVPTNWQNQQSGYRFDGAAPPSLGVDFGTLFELGTFTHFNYPIEKGTSIVSADLDVNIDLTVDGVFFEDIGMTLNFDHNETPNDGPHPADIVTLTNAGISTILNANGQDYTLTLLGFLVDGKVITQFITDEKKTSSGQLVGYLTPTTVVPEPGTYLLLGTFLAFALLYGKRRKEAQS